MVLATFQHLDQTKQQRVLAALVTEFSQHPLAQAQVARIVKQADIARGADESSPGLPTRGDG